MAEHPDPSRNAVLDALVYGGLGGCIVLMAALAVLTSAALVMFVLGLI